PYCQQHHGEPVPGTAAVLVVGREVGAQHLDDADGGDDGQVVRPAPVDGRVRGHLDGRPIRRDHGASRYSHGTTSLTALSSSTRRLPPYHGCGSGSLSLRRGGRR